MLTEEIKNKILEFVALKPRSIDEIAKHIGKNWRTANSYVEKIARETGLIATRVFRKGTKGALKIVYFNVHYEYGSAYQKELLERIKLGKKKDDFSAFDIYQFVPEKKKSAFMEEQKDESKLALNKDLVDLIKNAKEKILIFSGNLSWADLIVNGKKFIELLEEIIERKKIEVSVLARVDVESVGRVKRFLSINKRIGKNRVFVRHREQPLRAIIIDKKIARLKEIKFGEKKNKYIFYNIYDVDWIEWLEKVFYDLFSCAIDAEKRIKEIEKIVKLR